jgi:hypothetical protein
MVYLAHCYRRVYILPCSATMVVAGFFEVEVNGELVHSKKNGQGHVDTPEKLDAILAKISAALAAK